MLVSFLRVVGRKFVPRCSALRSRSGGSFVRRAQLCVRSLVPGGRLGKLNHYSAFHFIPVLRSDVVFPGRGMGRGGSVKVSWGSEVLLRMEAHQQ